MSSVSRLHQQRVSRRSLPSSRGPGRPGPDGGPQHKLQVLLGQGGHTSCSLSGFSMTTSCCTSRGWARPFRRTSPWSTWSIRAQRPTTWPWDWRTNTPELRTWSLWTTPTTATSSVRSPCPRTSLTSPEEEGGQRGPGWRQCQTCTEVCTETRTTRARTWGQSTPGRSSPSSTPWHRGESGQRLSSQSLSSPVEVCCSQYSNLMSWMSPQDRSSSLTPT